MTCNDNINIFYISIAILNLTTIINIILQILIMNLSFYNFILKAKSHLFPVAFPDPGKPNYFSPFSELHLYRKLEAHRSIY